MKKYGSITILVIGFILLMYGFIIALGLGVAKSFVPTLTAMWVITIYIFNVFTPQIKKKTWMKIVTAVILLLLIVNSVSDLSSLTRLPNDIQTDVRLVYNTILFRCPHIYVLLGMVFLVIGGLSGKIRDKALEEKELNSLFKRPGESFTMSKNMKMVSKIATCFLLLGVLICIYLQVFELLSYQGAINEYSIGFESYISTLIIIDVLVVLLFIVFNSLPIILSSVFRKKGLYRLLLIAGLLHITNICFYSFHIFLPETKQWEILSVIGTGDMGFAFWGGFDKAGIAHFVFIIANILLLCLNIFYMKKNTWKSNKEDFV